MKARMLQWAGIVAIWGRQVAPNLEGGILLEDVHLEVRERDETHKYGFREVGCVWMRRVWSWLRIKMTVFWDAALCTLVEIDRIFRDAYQTTRPNIREDNHLHTPCRENLKFHWLKIVSNGKFMY
jgi:hypothetical protein